MAHYFQAEPTVASAPRVARLALPDLRVDLRTDRGVFSYGEVDIGTRLLLLESPPPPAGPVVDLGCGYGPIAVTLARRNDATTVWALDVNTRARDLTDANAAAAGVSDRVRTTSPDDAAVPTQIAGLWSNPPVRVGKAVLYPLLEGWLDRLAPDAAAWLVAHKHLGADSLAAHLDGSGFTVERVCTRQSYRVLRIGAR